MSEMLRKRKNSLECQRIHRQERIATDNSDRVSRGLCDSNNKKIYNLWEIWFINLSCCPVYQATPLSLSSFVPLYLYTCDSIEDGRVQELVGGYRSWRVQELEGTGAGRVQELVGTQEPVGYRSW